MKRIALLAGAVLCLAACSGGGDGDVAKISFWHFWPQATVEPLVRNFEAIHPDIQVEVQQLTWASGLEKITAAVAAGSPPDLCELGSTWFSKFASAGALVDVTQFSEPLRDRYVMWGAATYQGRVLALPWLTGTRVVFYNRELALASGLDADHPPRTWEQFLTWAKALHKPEAKKFGFGLNSGERYVQFKKFMPFAWSNGGGVLSEDGTRCMFNSRENREALEFYLSLKPYSLLEKQEVIDQAFKDGRVGMMISGAWMLKTIARDAPDLDYGVCLIPRPGPSTGGHASFGGGELLAVFNKSKHAQAALELAEFLMQTDNAMAITRTEESVLPAARGADRDPFFREDPRRAVFLRQLETSVFPPNHASWVEIEDVVDRWLEKAVYEQESPRDALVGACKDISEILNK